MYSPDSADELPNGRLPPGTTVFRTERVREPAGFILCREHARTGESLPASPLADAHGSARWPYWRKSLSPGSNARRASRAWLDSFYPFRHR